MSNTFKYSGTTEGSKLNIGKWRLDGGGPTEVTDYWNGIDPPSGGYTIYKAKEENGPSIRLANNNAECLKVLNDYGFTGNTIEDGLLWALDQDDLLVINDGFDNIVTDGLVLYLDAAKPQSYPGSGTTWNDLSGNGNDSSLVGVNFNSNYMSFPGTGERDSEPVGEHITLNTSATTTDPFIKPNGVTYNVWMRFTGNQITGHGIFYGSTTINHIEYRGSDTNTGYWRTEAVLQNGYSFGAGSSGGHPLNEWFNLTIVFANNENNRPVRWYVNSEIFHTGDMTSGNNPSGEYFRPNAFGKSTGTDTYKYVESFKGDLSILQIYNRSLTSEEILQNYNATKGRFL